ncbi:MAG: hypothetical protein NT070_06930 [Cyanobacteria bacterium]|nr:hypothetical protein [Cyanobacteriota bacterium]
MNSAAAVFRIDQEYYPRIWVLGSLVWMGAIVCGWTWRSILAEGRLDVSSWVLDVP